MSEPSLYLPGVNELASVFEKHNLYLIGMGHPIGNLEARQGKIRLQTVVYDPAVPVRLPGQMDSRVILPAVVDGRTKELCFCMFDPYVVQFTNNVFTSADDNFSDFIGKNVSAWTGRNMVHTVFLAAWAGAEISLLMPEHQHTIQRKICGFNLLASL